MASSYNKIVGPNVSNTNVTNGYVFVLPKSGTVFSTIFFHVYEKILKNQPIDEQMLINRVPRKNLFGKSEFIVCHSECPGYIKSEKNKKLLSAWKQIKYFTGGWDGPKAILRSLGNLMDDKVPQHLLMRNKQSLQSCRIVFIFRNPLDQLVSYYRHQWHSVTDDHKYKTGPNAASITLEQFIFDEGGLDSWIKQFYSYHVVSQKYPDHILFVPYEILMNDKLTALTRIVNHLGIPLSIQALQSAINLTSKEKLRDLEDRNNVSLSGDQALASERHIRNGGIGIWQSQMTTATVQRIENRLKMFGLSLDMFYLADQLEPKFATLLNSFTKKLSPRPVLTMT